MKNRKLHLICGRCGELVSNNIYYFDKQPLTIVKDGKDISKILVTCPNCKTQFNLLEQFALETKEGGE